MIVINGREIETDAEGYLAQAGRALCRHAEADGLRLIRHRGMR